MPHDKTLCFGPYRLAGPHGPLWRDNQVIPLPPKILALLWTLVQQAGQVVPKATLLDTVWADTTVSDAALTTALRILRRALGEDPKAPCYIATVHRLGYRFVAPVRAMGLSPPITGAADAVALPPNVRSAAPLLTLVGREAELSQLHACFAQVLHGRRQTVFVAGEAGVGKTTLVDAFLHQIAATETLWLGRGQCIEHYGAGEAYMPVLDALGRLGREPGGERLVTCLRQYAPTWLGQLPALLPPAARENAPRTVQSITQTRMLRELVEALEALAAERPLVLVLEDLHWSDVSTVEALALLARRRDVAPLLMLGTYRPVELIVQDHPFKTVQQELSAHGQCVDIPLGYLRRDAVAAYLAQHGGAPDGDDGIAAWVYRRTMGHPLFMVQVLDYLVQHGHLGAAAPALAGGAGITILDQQMPQRLQQLIEAQLGRLDTVAQQVLEVGSVAGVEFVVASVAAGLQMAPEAVEAVCERLARQGQFLEERSLVHWPDGTVSGQYGFRHALYQEVLYQRIGAGRRARLHLLLGSREEAGYGTQASVRAAELAMHFECGRDYWRAVQYLRQAAETAARRSAQHEAIRLLTKGIELLTHLPDTPERAQHELALRIPLGNALIAVRGYAAPEVEVVFTRAYELCQHWQESAPRFAVLHGLHRFYYVRGEFQRARAVGEHMVALAHHPADPVLSTEAHRAMGIILWHQGEFRPANVQFEQGLATYDRRQQWQYLQLSGQDPGAVCLAYSALNAWLFGFPVQAQRRMQEAVQLARALAHPFTLTYTLHFAAMLAQFQQQRQATMEQAEASMKLADAHGFTHFLSLGMMLHGWALPLQGQGDTGLAEFQQGLALFHSTGAALGRHYYLGLFAEAQSLRGHITEALRLVVEALTAVSCSGRFWEAELHRLRGELLLQGSTPARAAEAETCLQQALSLTRQQGARTLELRAALSLSRLWQQQGKRVQAYNVLAPVYGWFSEGGETATLQAAKALLEEVWG